MLAQNFFSEKENYIALQVYQLKQKIIKSAFGKLHIKLIMSYGPSSFSH